jgi:PAS domain S-box-containing protein
VHAPADGLFARVFHSSSDAMTVTRMSDGRIEEANRAFCRLVGYAADELIGRTTLDLDIWADAADRAAFRAAVAEQGAVSGVHVPLRRRGEGWRQVELSAQVVDIDGEPCLLSIMRDVTEAHVQREHIRESEARKRAMLESSLDPVIAIDAEGRIVEFNRAAERTFGLSCEDALDREIGETIIPPHLREAHRRGLARHLATGESRILGRRIEITGMRADGSQLPVELTVVRIPGPGAPMFTAYLRDITDRVEAERRRAAHVALTRALAEATTLQDGAPALLRGLCESLDLGAAVLWLADAKEHGLRAYDVWHPTPAGRARLRADSEARTFARGVGIPGHVLVRRRAEWVADLSGDARFVRAEAARELGLVSGFWVPAPAGTATVGVLECFGKEVRPADEALLQLMAEVSGHVGQFIARARADQELRASESARERLLEDMLRAEQEQRSRLAADLHDDTIQAMTASLLTLDSLAAAAAAGDSDAVARGLARARTTLAEATERTRRLMFGLRPPVLEELGLGPAIADLVDEAAHEAGFETDVDVRVGRYPWAIEEVCYRAVAEAVANARKHSGAAHLSVTVEDRDGVLHGRVADDGRGFDVAGQFDRRSRKLHLGFDAVDERIRSCGGKLSVESSAGRGTRVRFELPAATAAAGTPAIAARA